LDGFGPWIGRKVMSAQDILMAAAGAGGAAEKTYIEDVFSTYLYTGNGSTQTINNGIDLAGEGGMVWIKDRSGANSHVLVDTARGATKFLRSNSTNAEVTDSARVSAFTASGFTVGSDTETNASSATYASWTFRKAPKFFDVVTYTGNGADYRQISHNLGSTPGMVIVKSTSASGEWAVWHRNNGSQAINYFCLNRTDAGDTSASYNNFATSTVIKIGSAEICPILGTSNTNGVTYVAYLFAHDTTTDGLIQCGSYTGNGLSNGPTINLGWEPQYLLVKNATTGGTGDYNWRIVDNMRGLDVSGANKMLYPNLANAEGDDGLSQPMVTLTSTGFRLTPQFPSSNASLNKNGDTFIYMAIRRGPMKTPTDPTKVFSPITNSNATGTVNTTGFPVDLQVTCTRASTGGKIWLDRLRGVSSTTTETNVPYLLSNSTAAEASAGFTRLWDNTGFQTRSGASGTSVVYWNFQRAPGFFDVVCYTGTGVARTVNHNLGVAPELMIVKERNGTNRWKVCYAPEATANKSLELNNTSALAVDGTIWNSTAPTSTVFSLNNAAVNTSSNTYVAYLFASCPGVSKVGSYTGTGATQTISCGFTGGARFVLIKRTDSTGDWYVWDTARGMVAGTDPRLALNLTSAESNANWVYTTTGGFQIVTTDASVNASGGSYIYLAIS
jgi:hypothetical protein